MNSRTSATRQARAELGQEGPDLGGRAGRALAGSRVVGADHQDDDPGRDTGHLTVAYPPEHIDNLVPGKAQVHRPPSGVVALPDLLARVLPAVGDGVADPQQINVAPLHPGHLGRVALLPPGSRHGHALDYLEAGPDRGARPVVDPRC